MITILTVNDIKNQFFRFRPPQQLIDHLLHLLIHPLEISVEHDFLLALGGEGIDFGEIYIEGFLLLDFIHVEVGLAEVLGGLELLRFLDVDAVEGFHIRGSKVTRRLTGQPTRHHVGYLGCRNEVVHFFGDGSRYLLVVDGDGLGGLFRLAEHIVLCPLQRLLVAGGTHKNVAAGGDNLLHTVLAVSNCGNS